VIKRPIIAREARGKAGGQIHAESVERNGVKRERERERDEKSLQLVQFYRQISDNSKGPLEKNIVSKSVIISFAFCTVWRWADHKNHCRIEHIDWRLESVCLATYRDQVLQEKHKQIFSVSSRRNWSNVSIAHIVRQWIPDIPQCTSAHLASLPVSVPPGGKI